MTYNGPKEPLGFYGFLIIFWIFLMAAPIWAVWADTREYNRKNGR